MKKYIVLATISTVFFSCNRQHNLAMKSADKEFILSRANDFYARKKWSKAISLYDRLPNLVAGTEDAPEVVFKSAYANFYDKNYKLAGHQFRNFANTFTRDIRREEAAYMSAVSYYEESPEYNLDQSSTESAINYLQDFLNDYPNSERAEEANKKIEILTNKLEKIMDIFERIKQKQPYNYIRQYFKMADYRSTVLSFENLLEDYPSTKYRQQSIDYIMKAKFELGMHSIYDLKKDRLENAIAYARQIENDYPNTNSAKDALSMKEKLTKELEKHLIIMKEVEAKKAEFLEKQKEREHN